MKQNLKIFALIVVFATFNSCQQDDELLNQHEHGEIIPSPKSDISFGDFLNKINVDYRKNGNKVLDKYHFGYKTKSNSKNANDSIIQYIDTTNVVSFEFDYVQSYTFNAVVVSDTLNYFYNVVFYQNAEGLQSKILKYSPDFDFVNSNLPFTGVIYEIDEFGEIIKVYNDTSSETNNKSNTVEQCAFSTSIVDVPCTGIDENGDPTEHTVLDGCTCHITGNCSPAFSFEVTTLECVTVAVGGGNTDNESGENTGYPGGGGENTSDPNQNEDGTFNLPTDPVKTKNINQEPTPEQKLKAITDVLEIKSKLNIMKNDSGFFEKGLRIDKHPETGVYVVSDILG